jgi:hypothetical protein
VRVRYMRVVKHFAMNRLDSSIVEKMIARYIFVAHTFASGSLIGDSLREQIFVSRIPAD